MHSPLRVYLVLSVSGIKKNPMVGDDYDGAVARSTFNEEKIVYTIHCTHMKNVSLSLLFYFIWDNHTLAEPIVYIIILLKMSFKMRTPETDK